MFLINPLWCGKIQSYDEVDKIDTDTMVFSASKKKHASIATPIRHIDFVIPDQFNNVIDSKNSLFFVLPKVTPDVKQASSVRILILQHLKT